MKISEIINRLNASIVNFNGVDSEIIDGYTCDFLSNVYCKSLDNYAWFTIMNNKNVCAVATKTKLKLVVLCENVMPDEQMLLKAKENCINVISTNLDAFHAIKLLDK